MPALLAALREDRIDIPATDRVSHTTAEKDQPDLDAAAGLPLVQDFLPALLDRVSRGELSIEQVVRKSSHNVARRFDIADRGFIRAGYRSDVVLADPDTPTGIDADGVLSKYGWSTFEGGKLNGSVKATLVSGEPVWLDGQLTGTIAGNPLHFAK